MVLRRLIFSALIIGVIFKVLLNAAQTMSVNPVIPHAKTFDVTAAQSLDSLAQMENNVLSEIPGVAVVMGILVIAFVPLRYKMLGVVAMMLPYLTNIPFREGATFIYADPEVVEVQTGLHQKFIIVSSLNNLLFWLAQGIFSALFIKFWIHEKNSAGANAHF